MGPKLVHKNLFTLRQNSSNLRAITQRTASSFVIVSQEENIANMIADRVHKNGYGNGGPPWSGIPSRVHKKIYLSEKLDPSSYFFLA